MWRRQSSWNWHRFIELGPHRIQRGHQPVGADLRDHLALLVRLLARLVDKARLAEFDQHALGARRHQARVRADQQLARPDTGARYLRQARFTGLQILEYLPHTLCPTQYWAAEDRH